MTPQVSLSPKKQKSHLLPGGLFNGLILQ